MITAHSATGNAVSLTWSAVTPPGSGTVSYYALRDGGAAGGNCGTAASPITALTCTDNAPSSSSPTTYSYVVVAVWRSWTSTSASVSQLVKGGQTITFTSTAPANAKVGGATYTVTATGGASGNPVTFTSGTPTVCTSSGTDGATITFIAAATCTINANQAGNANYNAAPQGQQTFTVAKGDQTITFTSTAPAGAKVGGATYTATATATSGLTVTFGSNSPSVCLAGGANGATITFVGAGTCIIRADQSGNSNWNGAPQTLQSFTVAKGDQTITFTSTAPAGAKVGGATYTATATATSGLAVAFTSATPSVCTSGGTNGATITFVAVGTCTVNANQAGNANYNAAPQVQQSFTVAKGDQTITFTSTAPAARDRRRRHVHGHRDGDVGSHRCLHLRHAERLHLRRDDGATITFVAVGTCTVNANQAGNANYNAAPQVQQSFTVAKGDQTITFTSTAPASATVGGATYTATATATSGLTVAFTSATPSVCTSGGRRRHHHVRRRRHLHGQRQPGGQRQLQRRSAGAAVVRRRRQPHHQQCGEGRWQQEGSLHRHWCSGVYDYHRHDLRGQRLPMREPDHDFHCYQSQRGELDHYAERRQPQREPDVLRAGGTRIQYQRSLHVLHNRPLDRAGHRSGVYYGSRSGRLAARLPSPNDTNDLVELSL